MPKDQGDPSHAVNALICSREWLGVNLQFITTTKKNEEVGHLLESLYTTTAQQDVRPRFDKLKWISMSGLNYSSGSKDSSRSSPKSNRFRIKRLSPHPPLVAARAKSQGLVTQAISTKLTSRTKARKDGLNGKHISWARSCLGPTPDSKVSKA